MPNISGILYQPIDVAQFNRQALHEMPEPLKPILQSKAKLILTPSRLSQPGIGNDKNLGALIRLLAHLKAQNQSFQCVIIGEDSSSRQVNTKALLAQAESLGVAERFTILPPTFEIEAYYRYADVVVTLAPREPFGRTVVEAIACGIPVVGSSTGGIGEILGQCAPDWRVDPHDPIAAAEKVLQVLNDPTTATRLETAASWIEDYCNVTDYAQQLLKITGIDRQVQAVRAKAGVEKP